MKFKLITSFFLLIPFFLSAQHTNVLIDDNGAPEEPSIYVDPNNTDHLIAGSNINNYYYSYDGGYTWDEGTLISPAYGVWGDPCVIIDTAGHFYFFHLSSPPWPGNWIDRIVCQKSTDLGLTWNEGSYMGLNGAKAQDKEWAVVDRNNNNIYVTWTQFDSYGSSNPNDSSIIRFSGSTDGGQTWSEAVRLCEVAGDCIDNDNTVEGAVPTVGPNGEIYVSWAGPAGIVFDKSSDQGNSWLDNDIFVSDMPGGWAITIPGIMRCNGMPVTSCDISGGPHHGTIYINWADQRNGEDDTDIWLTKSTDAGETWSEPKRVNDDAPGKQQFFTWMDIDQTSGYIYFVFYDRRNYDDKLTDVYMAVSKDGGETFVNFKVSETPFSPISSIFFGDYNNISVYNGVIRPMWTRLHNGNLSVWTAIVNPEFVGMEEEIADKIPFNLKQNYPNPFTGTTYFSFKLYHPSQISLKIYDMYGREITTLINKEFMDRGKYVNRFDAVQYNLSPGVYYFSLTGDNQNIQKKMLYLK